MENSPRVSCSADVGCCKRKQQTSHIFCFPCSQCPPVAPRKNQVIKYIHIFFFFADSQNIKLCGTQIFQIDVMVSTWLGDGRTPVQMSLRWHFVQMRLLALTNIRSRFLDVEDCILLRHHATGCSHVPGLTTGLRTEQMSVTSGKSLNNFLVVPLHGKQSRAIRLGHGLCMRMKQGLRH